MKTMWPGALRAALIWTKASRCRRKVSKSKSLLKQVQTHLTIQKNRRDAIVRQARVDIAHLLRNGHLQQAFARVEKLHKDQCLLAAYDQIDYFCNSIITSSPDVCKHKTVQELPKDVREAVASLIFAASRCGELPELRLLRGLFKDQYGWEFDNINVELRPGNCVNSQLKEKLCITRMPDDVKEELISDVMKNSSVQLALQDSEGTARQEGVTALKSYSLPDKDPKYEQKANGVQLQVPKLQTASKTGMTQNYSFPDKDFKYEHKPNGIQIQVPKPETARKAGIVCSMSNGKLSVATPSHSGIGSNSPAGLVGSNNTKRNAVQDHCNTGNMDMNIDSGDRNARSRTYAMTSLPRRSLIGKRVPSKSGYAHLSPGDAVNKEGNKMAVKGRHSFNVSVDEHKLPNGKSPCHVHPKLPEYDDLVAKLRSLKAENRRQKSFSFFGHF